MIRNEAEYQHATTRLEEERGRLAEHRERLKATGLSDEAIKRVIDPIESFHLQLKEEVESYEQLKRGEFDDLENLRGLGTLLISLRIAQGISQRDLAKRLGVHESQVSRDEAFYRDEIGVGHALLLAKLQPAQQEEALAACYQEQYTNGAGKPKRILLPVRHLQQWIEHNILLELAAAPFSKENAALVPEAGSCVDCPKRTGHNVLLFEGIHSHA